MMQNCNCEGCELKLLFFDNLESPEINYVCNNKIEKIHPKGNIIIKEGELIKQFSYLKSGLIKLCKNVSNKSEQIISFAQPLDFVSLINVFSDIFHSYTVVALEESIVCSLDIEIVRQFAIKNGKFAMNLIEKLSKASDKIIMTMLEIRTRRLYGRVAYILLYFSEKIYKNNVFELPVSRKEIADFIGMTTENVIRTLSEFRKDKIIKINGKEIEIINKAKLQFICDNN